MRETHNFTLASALDTIATEISCTSLDSFLETGCPERDFICDTLGLTPLQASLFATILEKSGDNLATTKDMVSTLNVSKIRFLGFKKEIDELTKKRLVVARLQRRDNNSMGYRVSQAVVKAIQNNTSIEPEKVEGLSTRGIFSKLHNIFADVVNNVNSSEIAIHEIIDLMNHNSGNQFVDALIRRGVNSLKDADMMFIFFYMLHRNVAFNDNEFTTDELLRLFDDPLELSELIFNDMKSGETELHEKGLIEFLCDDGMENRDCFRVPDKVLGELLSDLGGVGAKQKTNIPKDELISHSDIRTKKMFYNEEEGNQVKSLTELLKEEQFSKVQGRLREKGLRSGFCCLFYGPAGTGKTETVMQIAKATGRDIFIVDMSKLKSKWMGESEKNIKQVFNTYRNLVNDSVITPIIVFNEADAIFGKRINVESSVDKSFNAIQNIILQEMENLDGILIATTNLSENFDSAFERRFLYKIHFKIPSTYVKARIWRSMIDNLSEDDAARLASGYGFTGGQIENITRKLDVDYILSGDTPDMEKILSFCKAESIQKQTQSPKIGF